MTNPWKVQDAEDRIQKRLKEVEDVEVCDYSREMSLQNIPVNRAYRLDGVHVYLDILNLEEILNGESDRDLQRALRFLNLHYRAVHRVLNDVDAIKVDFAGPRLHAVVAKPYASEAERIHRAIAMAQLIVEVLRATGDDDQNIPAARVRVGIDSGLALVVNNGRRGNRESLFLGEPANQAAKLAAHGRREGIYLSNIARRAIGLEHLAVPGDKALTGPEVTVSQQAAKLGLDKDYVVKQWRQDLGDAPLKTFEFYAHTPPFSTLDIFKTVSPGHTVRQEAVSIYADIDGFTKYVAKHIKEDGEDIVRALHVIRSELDAVLHANFGGRKIRFIGDCIHGVLAEGTAYTTDAEASVSKATMAAGAMRSSFGLCLTALNEAGADTAGLDLAIGFDYGKVTITRLGMKGGMIRCATSKAVLSSEAEQQRCDGQETAIGKRAYDLASKPVRDLFSSGSRKAVKLDYGKAFASLTNAGDKAAARVEEAFRAGAPATVAAAGGAPLRAYAAQKKGC